MSRLQLAHPHLHRCCTLNNVLDLYYHFFLKVFLEDKMQQVERSAWTSNVISIKFTFRPRQFHWMIEAIMGVGSGKSFSCVENPSAVLPLEIYSEISSFLMAIHPLEMVNHPEEHSIWTPPPHHQCPFLPCSVVATDSGFEL